MNDANKKYLKIAYSTNSNGGLVVPSPAVVTKEEEELDETALVAAARPREAATAATGAGAADAGAGAGAGTTRAERRFGCRKGARRLRLLFPLLRTY